MKRLILMIAVFLAALTFAGCEILPDDIEAKVTQELCADDPDNALCDLENIEQLEEQVVVELVNNAMTTINDDGCPDILFSGSKSLIDTCQNNPEELIPDGVTSLEVLSFKQKDEQYIVYGKTNLEGLELEIKISVVEIDGKTFIDDWATNKIIVDSDEISEQGIDFFFDIFFKNFSDSDLSNDEFCAIYYHGEDNDCDGLRDSFFMNNIEITGHSLTRTKDYEFRGHVTVLKLHGGTQDVEVETRLIRESFGPVQVVSLVPNTEIDDEQADLFFDVFFDAYTDTAISSEAFCNTYFEGDQESCRVGRNSSIGNYASITPKGNLSKKGYDYYKNASAQNASGETLDIEVVLTLSKRAFGSITVSMIDVPSQGQDDLDIVEERLSLMFANLYDQTITDNQLRELYLLENIPDRVLVNDEYDSIEFLSIERNDDDTVSTKVRVKFKAGAELSKKVNITFEEDDDGELKTYFRFVDPEQPNPDIDIPYIEAYFRDYFDSEIEDEDFYAMYEGPRGHAGSKKDKKRISSDSVTVNVYESNAKYLVEITGETESERILWRLDVRVNRWESSVIMDFNDNDDDCDGFCDFDVTDRAEHEMLFNWFIDDYFNPDITNEEFNKLYFGNMINEDFFEIRKEVQDMKNRYQINDQVGPIGGTLFLYLLDVGEEGNLNGEIVPVQIRKRIDKSSPLLFILDDDDDGDGIPTVEEVMNRLSDFQALANSHSVAYSAMCDAFTPNHRVDSCAQILSTKTATGYQLVDLVRLQQRPDILMAEWENAVGDVMIEYYYFFPYYNEMNEVIFEIIPYTPSENDMLEFEIEMYVSSLNNPMDSVNDTCMYVDESSQDECIQLKTYLIQSKNQVGDYYLYFDSDLETNVLSINIYTVNMEYVGTIEYDVAMLESNPLHIDRGTRATNPLFE